MIGLQATINIAVATVSVPTKGLVAAAGQRRRQRAGHHLRGAGAALQRHAVSSIVDARRAVEFEVAMPEASTDCRRRYEPDLARRDRSPICHSRRARRHLRR